MTTEPGDIILVSTGRDARRAQHGPWDPVQVGLAGLDPECVVWLRAHDPAVLGADGVSDPLPPNPHEWPMPIHQCTLVGMGVHLLDNLQLGRPRGRVRAGAAVGVHVRGAAAADRRRDRLAREPGRGAVIRRAR